MRTPLAAAGALVAAGLVVCGALGAAQAHEAPDSPRIPGASTAHPAHLHYLRHRSHHPLHHRSHHRELTRIRRATTAFHDIATAEAAGYVPFRDIHGVSCIAMKGMGGMGVHYVNPALIADPAIDPTKPEALVYAPSKDGTLRLAALEYLVDKSAWSASATSRAPRIFAGHPFSVTTAPNRYGLPTFYSQHVWAYKHNPAGQLAMWNPRVHCH